MSARSDEQEHIACGSCDALDVGGCPASDRACGHHCNHSWTHDECCWCRVTFTESGREVRCMSETPNKRAARPTGMCGSASKCTRCPSDFLCHTKAMAERDLIVARNRPGKGGAQ